MKKLFLMMASALLLLAVGCSKYDDSELNGRIDSLEQRLSALETVMRAYENNLFIKSVQQIDNGYVITFSDGSTATITNGKDGQNGKDGADGKDGTNGKDGKDGTDGQNGSDGKNGADGKDGADGKNGADGKDGETLIQNIVISDDEVTFILTDGRTFSIPMYSALNIIFNNNDMVAMLPNTTRDLRYTIESELPDITVEVVSSADIKAIVVQDDNTNKTGVVRVSTSSVIDEYSKIVIIVSNGEKAIVKTIVFEEAGLQLFNYAIQLANPEGDICGVGFLTNTPYEVIIPEDAKSWISLQDAETRALEYTGINLVIAPNSTNEIRRSAYITIKSIETDLSITYRIDQWCTYEYLEHYWRELLTELYRVTDGDNWTRKENWCTDKDLNEWEGVGINTFRARHNAMVLSLAGNNLTGKFEDVVSIIKRFDVSMYDVLMHRNHLTGSIPQEILDIDINTVSLPDGNTDEIRFEFGGNYIDVSNVSPEIARHIGESNMMQDIEGAEERFREALIALYNATNGDNWHNNTNWCSDKPFEEWYGIQSFGNTGMMNIYQLNLKNNNLSGKLSDELGELGPSVFHIILDDNPELCGDINEILESLNESIQYFDADNTGLSGEIKHIKDFPMLKEISLANTKIFGTLPNDLSGLSNLTGLWISNTEIGGELPDFSCCPNLTVLELPDNKFTTFPKGLGNLPKFLDLNLNNNEVHGVIPSELGNCTDLTHFQAINNHLTGTIPVALGRCRDLTVLNLSNNNLTGTLPQILGNCKGLKYLHVDGNRMSGYLSESLPILIWNPEQYIYPQQAGYGFEPFPEPKYHYDGEIKTCQLAKKGKGIDLFIVGDGYNAGENAVGGLFDFFADTAVEDLFVIEPMKSFREYFNVHIIYSHSPASNSNKFLSKNDDFAALFEVVRTAVPDAEAPLVLLLNNSSGDSFTFWYEDESAVAVVNTNDTFPMSFPYGYFWLLVQHEFIGHGFAKLGDEYFDPYNLQSVPPEVQAEVERGWREHGWYANIDFTDDWSLSKWKPFLELTQYNSDLDNDYIYGYHIGILPGGMMAYWYNIYNAGESLMGLGGYYWFNTPSRWAIYKRIMELSGEGYSFDKFVEYDKINRNHADISTMTSYSNDIILQTKSPVVINKTWREVLE